MFLTGRVGEVLLVQGDGSGQVPSRLVGGGEVVARGQGVRVVGAEDPLPVGEVLLVQGDGPGQVPSRRMKGSQAPCEA